MTSNDPAVIRAQIEQTRADLSNNVNALTDSVRPSSVAKRQTDKVKGAVTGVKDKVMGSAADAGSQLGSAQSSVADTISSAPAQLRSSTGGNPLAAGLIAFGVGWLTASLLPASQAEQDAAAKVKDTAAPIISDAAKEVAGNLQQPAQQAVDSVKDTATEAVNTVKDEGASAAQDIGEQAKTAKDTVQDQQNR
jgi:hypothetical protein